MTDGPRGRDPFPRHQPFVVLCCDPLSPRAVDPVFAEEARTAEGLGFLRLLVDHDAAAAGNVQAALRRVAPDGPGVAVYRGWMLHASAYAALHAGLAERGVTLVNDPASYSACHHLPEAFARVGRWMPETRWVDADAMDDPNALASALAPFGSAPVTVKDWVKSQAAGYWDEACLIPDASDARSVERVTRRFRELQGDDLVGGLVFRRFVRLDATVPEWRGFSLRGRPVGCWPRSDGGRDGPAPPRDRVEAIAMALPSPFASFDLARAQDGGWILVETGDGQVSGLPPGSAPDVLAALRDGLGPR